MTFLTMFGGRTAINLDQVKMLMVCKNLPEDGTWRLEALYFGDSPITICTGPLAYCKSILDKITKGNTCVSDVKREV